MRIVIPKSKGWYTKMASLIGEIYRKLLNVITNKIM